jgi:hypothetical protein
MLRQMLHRVEVNLQEHIPLKSLEDFRKLMWCDKSDNLEASLCVIGYHWLLIRETLSAEGLNEPQTQLLAKE